ncbi:hypothetical protein [Actinoplanes aureus]|uniref:Uncharacterized protein n=1 Tax=Actinoplanes aureus TaxID=2792083 RepID=A0A931C3X7_9ACTN|nr:hypothetical protein [Actinoplanes aureus]MBG0562955.1 hypothetical protein [Actinoplanes aureus]
MRGAHLFAATAALLAGLSGAAPARAADTPVTMTFAVAPDEVRQGSRIVLAGRAGFGNRGNAGPVDLYFRKSENDPYVRLSSIAATSSGRFRTTLTARASGDYQAVYRGNKLRGPASGSDFLAVYTTSSTDRLVYSWSGTRLQCHPTCLATGPAQSAGPAPIRVTFKRTCAQPKSGGSLGFTADPANARKPGDRGWRDFPDGVGPTEFELTPPATGGHFHLRWSSPAGKDTSCDLAFTAIQRHDQKRYL